MTSGRSASAAMGEVASRLVTAWARIAEQVWRNGFQLWKVPAELAEAEDATLGVWRTSVYFQAPPNTAVNLRCASVKEVPAGRPIGGQLSTDPRTYQAVDGRLQEIVICLPPNTEAGLYEVTLEDETSGTCAIYLLPFGVPGRRH